VPAPPPYEPPNDLPSKISELLDTRQPLAKALFKSLTHSIGVAEKKHGFVANDGVSNDARAEMFALQIERAVHDTHPTIKEYGSQIKTLAFNLKNNPDLCQRLLAKTLTPPVLAVMTTDQLASKELQRETAEMKARAEKQSILVTDDGPRVRRTHKGEEVVETTGTGFTVPSEDKPSALRRQSVREHDQDRAVGTDSAPGPDAQQSTPKEDGHAEAQQSPKTEFDINKVFSTVRSPTAAQHRRPSQPVPSGGPGIDPDVDRLLQDDREESPPYSPTAELDPDVIWRGQVVMNTVADLQATAKHVAGNNLNKSINLPWTTLIPKKLNVVGRIDEQKANEYLCGLRYSAPTDIVVVSIHPATEAAKSEFHALLDYFVSKKRYGVVGDKGIGKVRDTYLIPVLPGVGNHPEFMLNLEDNELPNTRDDPVILVVFVYRNDSTVMEKMPWSGWAAQQNMPPGSDLANTPTPAGHGGRPSISGPAFSPTSPQGAFPPRTGPVHPPTTAARAPPAANGGSARNNVPASPGPAPGQEVLQRQREGEARQLLGELANSPTFNFIVPQAYQMTANEWLLIKGFYEREPRSRDDLAYLATLIEGASIDAGSGQPHAPQQGNAPPAILAPTPPPKTSQTPVPIPQVPHPAGPAQKTS
jgi:hypothetical protein